MSSSPATIRSAVVLPQPDGPTRTMNSPSAISRSSRSTARVPSLKTFETRSKTTLAIRHSFTPPPTRPRTSARCESTNTTATGSTASSVASASSGRKMLTDWPPPPAAGLNEGVEESRFESPDRDRVLVRVRKHDVRQEEVVPVGDEAEEEDERHDRLRERQRDPAKREPLTAAVHACGVEQVSRERRGVVDVREVDAEREERERQDHRCRRARSDAWRSARGRSEARVRPPA